MSERAGKTAVDDAAVLPKRSKIGILLAVYNGASDLPQQLDSIAAQYDTC